MAEWCFACPSRAYWKIQPDPNPDGSPRTTWYACRDCLERVCLAVDQSHPGVESTLSREHHLAGGYPASMKAALGDQYIPYTCSCGKPWGHEGETT